MSVFLFKTREITPICVDMVLRDSIRFSTVELQICWRKFSPSLICIAEKLRSSCRWLEEQVLDQINNITKWLKLKIVFALLTVMSQWSSWGWRSEQAAVDETLVEKIYYVTWPLKSAYFILQFKESCFSQPLFSCLSIDLKKKKKENAESAACSASGCRIRPLWQIPLVSKCNFTTKAHCRTAEFWPRRALPVLSRVRELDDAPDDFLIPYT